MIASSSSTSRWMRRYSEFTRIAVRYTTRSQRRQLPEPPGYPVPDPLDHLMTWFGESGHRLVVGGDDLLVEVPGELHRHVLLGGQRLIETFHGQG